MQGSCIAVSEMIFMSLVLSRDAKQFPCWPGVDSKQCELTMVYIPSLARTENLTIVHVLYDAPVTTAT